MPVRVSYRVLRHGREWLPQGQFIHGRALFELGQVAERLAEMETGIAGCQRLGGVSRLQYLIALHAEATARAGRVEEAVATHETLAHVQQTGEQVELCRDAAAHRQVAADA
jgi:hypothetical protein